MTYGYAPIDPEHKARATALGLVYGPEINRLIAEAKQTLVTRGTLSDKRERIIDISEALCKLLTPALVCRKGCSHCCYMATAVSTYEAAMISRYTGRRIEAEGTVEEFARGDTVDKYAGKPCTFLVEGKCSIYPVRPIACRLHHNIADSEEVCRIKDVAEPKATPSFDTGGINRAYVTLALAAGDGFADIREFFPPKEL